MTPVKILDSQDQAVMAVSFSPDGRLLAAGGGRKSVVIYDLVISSGHLGYEEVD